VVVEENNPAASCGIVNFDKRTEFALAEFARIMEMNLVRSHMGQDAAAYGGVPIVPGIYKTVAAIQVVPVQDFKDFPIFNFLKQEDVWDIRPQRKYDLLKIFHLASHLILIPIGLQRVILFVFKTGCLSIKKVLNIPCHDDQGFFCLLFRYETGKENDRDEGAQKSH